MAQEISGQNALLVAQRNLQQIIGQPPDALTPLRTQLVIQTTAAGEPGRVGEPARARTTSPCARNEAVLEIADREVGRQRAGHYPTLDVVASAQENTNQSLAVGVGTRSQVNQNVIGLQLNLPIYSGGSVMSRTREAVALKEKARQDLEASRRAAEFNAQQAYLNVTNGLAQVKALEQALVSSETALQSNRVGYEVGVRINIDVLNAQQQVFQTKRDLARSRYDTIVNGLRLKAAAGALSEADVEDVNRLLGFDQPAPKSSATVAPLAAAAPTTVPARVRRGRTDAAAGTATGGRRRVAECQGAEGRRPRARQVARGSQDHQGRVDQEDREPRRDEIEDRCGRDCADRREIGRRSGGAAGGDGRAAARRPRPASRTRSGSRRARRRGRDDRLGRHDARSEVRRPESPRHGVAAAPAGRRQLGRITGSAISRSTIVIVRAVAPRCAAQNASPASPIHARAPASDSRRAASRTSAPASATCTAARSRTASAAASAKLNVDGPIRTGAPSAHASMRFCAPYGSRLPPTNATSQAA